MQIHNNKTGKLPLAAVIAALFVVCSLVAGGIAFAYILFPPASNENPGADKENLIATTQYIGEEAVKALVVAEVPGSAPSDITELYLEYGEGKADYKGTLTLGNMEYDFRVDAAEGTVMDWNASNNLILVSAKPSTVPGEKPTTNTNSTESAPPAEEKPTTNTAYIGIAAAKAIALKKVPGATFKEVSLEYDDGKVEYDGEMYLDQTDYKFKIDAVTGVILEWESDTEDISDDSDSSNSDDSDREDSGDSDSENTSD